jgi:hypothetical protein
MQPTSMEFLSTLTPQRANQRAALPTLAYRVGGITFGLTADEGLRLTLEADVQQFTVEPAAGCDVNLRISWADSLEIPRSVPLFQSGGLWTLFAERGTYRFSFLSTTLGVAPYKEAWFERDFRSGHVLLSRPHFKTSAPVYPLEYPLDELLMVHRLAQGEGVEVHAVGLTDENGSGHLFLGHSGAGKSTTARLWSARPGARILSDDRIVLRAHGGQIWMYGTPWHGDAGISSPNSALLSRIYLLEHGPRNECIPVAPGLAAAELFARSFVPHYSPEAIRFTLDFLDRLAHQIPCSVFRFVPDGSAVEAICRAAA